MHVRSIVVLLLVNATWVVSPAGEERMAALKKVV